MSLWACLAQENPPWCAFLIAIEPSSGQVLIDGEDISQLSDKELRELRRRKMSMVFQSFALMPHLNVLQNAAFGLELAGMGVEERHQRAMQALAQVGLDAVHMSYPDELSGGMQRVVSQSVSQ